MSKKVTVRIDRELLDEARNVLHQQKGESKENSYTATVERFLHYALHGQRDSQPGTLLRQQIENYGATLDDFVKGKVSTWARKQGLWDTEEPKEERPTSRLDDAIKCAIAEAREEEECIIQPTHIERQTPEVVEKPTYNSTTPPWERIRLVAWEKVLGLYPDRNKNPLINWAGEDETAQLAVRAALAHMPPVEWTNTEALRVCKELYDTFKDWEERYGTTRSS